MTASVTNLPWRTTVVADLPPQEAEEVLHRLREHPDQFVDHTPQVTADPELAGLGHNSGNTTPMAANDDTAKAVIIAEIQTGLTSRLGPKFEFMTAAEIGAAENRGVLLKLAHADGLAYLIRALDGLDPDHEGKRRGTTVVPYVFSYDCFFSDNPKGYSTVSNKRLASPLGLGERVVRYARNLLVELKVSFCMTIPGIGNAYHPIFSKKLTATNTQLTYWLDATSEPTKHGRRPYKPRHSVPGFV